MDRCPTCNAKYKGSPVCYRCKSDLSVIISIENQAAFHLAQAKHYIKDRAYDNALDALNKSLHLIKTEEGLNLKSYVFALKGDFHKLGSEVFRY